MRSIPVDRRALIGLGAALSASTLAGGLLAPPASGAVPRIVPGRADHLVESVGINIHLNWRTSVYGDHPRVIDWLERLGVRHVRTRLTPARDVLDGFAELSRRGIAVQGICGARGDDEPMDLIMSAVRQHVRRPGRVFGAFEGINEPNNDGVPWVGETRSKTEALHAARAAHGLSHVPVVAPSLARVNSGGVEGDSTLEQAQSLGSLADLVDVGNMHVYTGGRPPSEDIARFREAGLIVSGGRPLMCTEGGYFTAMDYPGADHPVPAEVAAAYAPQQVLEHWIRGTRRYFRYELLDEPDAGTTDREGTFGIISTQGGEWLPKPDFAPMNRLLTVFSDPGPQAFARRPLRMALRNGPADLRSASFVDRHGTHLVALWLDRYLWHPQKRQMMVGDLHSALDTVDVALDERRDVAVEHLVEPGVTRRRLTARYTTVGLPAGVTVLRIR